MAKAGRGSDQFMVRLPKGMRDRISATAEKNGRSMNSEIVRALELAFPEPIPLREKLEDLGHLFSAMRKVRGLEGAFDVYLEELQDVVTSVLEGRGPEIDARVLRDMQKDLEMWKYEKQRREDIRRKAIEERYDQKKDD